MSINQPVYLGLSILKNSKVVVYECWYDYVKNKYEKNKLCYMDTDSFTVYIKKAFMQTLLKMLKQDLIPQTMNQKDQYLRKKMKI